MKQKNTNLKKKTNLNNTTQKRINMPCKYGALVDLTSQRARWDSKKNKINNKWIDTFFTILLLICILDMLNQSYGLTYRSFRPICILDMLNQSYGLTNSSFRPICVSENVPNIFYAYLSTDEYYTESSDYFWGDYAVDKFNTMNTQSLSESGTSTPALTDGSTVGDTSKPSTPKPYEVIPNLETTERTTDEIRQHIQNLLNNIEALENDTNRELVDDARALTEEINNDIHEFNADEETDSSYDSEETSNDTDQNTDSPKDTDQNADSRKDTDQNTDSSKDTSQNIDSSNNTVGCLYHKNEKKNVKQISVCSSLNIIHNTLAMANYSTLTSKNFYKNSESSYLKILHMKAKQMLESSTNAESDEKANNTYINVVNKVRHSPPSIKEWINSTYAYNKTSKNFPILDKTLSRLIRSHFNLYNNKLRKKIRKHGSKRFEIRKSRRLMNKVFIGKPELKHSNNNVVITVYVYNAEKKYLINKVKNVAAVYKINTPNDKNNINQAKALYLNKTKKTSVSIKSKLHSYKNKFFILKKIKTNKFNTNKHEKYFFKAYVRKFLRKETISNYYKQMLIFNKQKFEKKYVIHLANNVAKLYNKKIEFNFISLRHIYLDSQIFSTSLMTKLKRLARVKKSFLIGLKRFLNMFKIPRINSLHTYNEIFNRKTVNQSINNSNVLAIANFTGIIQDDHVNNDTIDNTLNYEKYITITDINGYKDYVITRYISTFTKAFNSVKYKIINGIRLEVAGRFTKRSSAARSVFKIRNKGSIKNKDSSYKGLPALLLKGYAKANLQYNIVCSKVRGGSFGIKGLLSGA